MGGFVDIIDEQEVVEDMMGVEISCSSNVLDFDIYVWVLKFFSFFDCFMFVK